jgi:glucose/arabinose dehydrogenase
MDPIPADNPSSISGIAGVTTGLNRAIWAAGVRNPYTFTFKPGTDVMYINDVGQNAWEEVDTSLCGSNGTRMQTVPAAA